MKLSVGVIQQFLNSNANDAGCADRDKITSDSICTYGGIHGPSRPLLRGRIIDHGDVCPISMFG
jgi:hypothetical protein